MIVPCKTVQTTYEKNASRVSQSLVKKILEENLGITQTDVAKKLGVSHQLVSRLKIKYNLPFIKIKSPVVFCCICGRKATIPSLELCINHYVIFWYNSYPEKFQEYRRKYYLNSKLKRNEN